VDFFGVETVFLRRLYVLAFTRARHWPCPSGRRHRTPDGGVGGSAGRTLLMDLGQRVDELRLLIRDRDDKFTATFDAVFASIGIGVITTPIRAPRAARTACINEMRALLVTAPVRLREQRPVRRAAGLAACARLEAGGDLSDPLVATTLALGHLAARYQALEAEIAELDRQLDCQLARLVKQARPDLLALKGVGTQIAAQLLIICRDNPDRLTSQASFASLCGVSPVPASSGKTQRHRLNRGGDRQANRALYLIAPSRTVHDPRIPRLPATPHPPGPHQTRNPALPQALHRPRALPDSDPTTNPGYPAKRSPNNRLTNIGASHRRKSPVLGEEEIAALARKVDDLRTIIPSAEPRDKEKLYAGIGLKMTYCPGREEVRAEINFNPRLHWLPWGN
jgi:hypothetical protein